MRLLWGYIAGAIAAALVATLIVGFVAGEAFVVRALDLPAGLGALMPDLAIQARRLAKLRAGTGLATAAPLVFAAATMFFLMLNTLGLSLFRATDAAWRGERIWEGPKVAWCAALFALMGVTVFLALRLVGGPLDWLRIEPGAIVLCSFVGGLAFGMFQPRDLPFQRPSRPQARQHVSTATLISTRRANSVLGR